MSNIMQINYVNMMNNLNILHSDTITNITDGLKFLIDTQSATIFIIKCVCIRKR